MSTLIAAARIAVVGIVTTFAALFILRGIIGALGRFSDAAGSTDAAGETSPKLTGLQPQTELRAKTLGKVALSDEELSAIVAALSAAMGVAGPEQEGRICIEEIPG